MARVKLEEEQELWEPAELKHSVVREFKHEPECREIQSLEDTSSVFHCKKEEPEEVEIKAELLPQFVHVSVKSEEGEPQSSLLHQMTEENREDTGSSETDDSQDWAPSAEKPKEQLHGPAHDSDRKKAKRHMCSDCGKRYRTGSKLRIHERTHTGERPFRCTVCQKDFTAKRYLNQHMGIHTEERPFKCTVCEKGYLKQSNLNEHMKSHSGEKPFECTVCEKRFITKSNLTEHMRTHTGERPFKCAVCTKDFTYLTNLNRHARTHTREKPFRCTVCGKSFITNSNLNEHMRIHSVEVPFRCTVCQKILQQSVTYNNT
uniref:C2H2-type domain-containing protein n=1 Tax=Neogobius melanostomus TaxID=47308 RepID=A0A8C6U0Q6_9GOBI